MADEVLLLGEVYVDFSLGEHDGPVKMRLGGLTHAARGLWACDIPYSVAAVCPSYLIADAQEYLMNHGCVEFSVIGVIEGAPNVVVIRDAREVGNQGYEDLLRDRRRLGGDLWPAKIEEYFHVVIFPGTLCLASLAKHFNSEASITIDIAYGVDSLDDLIPISGKISEIAISTSSELFSSLDTKNADELISLFRPFSSRLLLKENRGGSRLFNLQNSSCEKVFADLRDSTVNSVGVGDVFTAVFAGYSRSIGDDAVWRGMQAASRYSQTTDVDDFKRGVQRDLALDVGDVRSLGGVSLPWYDRPALDIYLAAPDFSYVDRHEVEIVVEALKYHNFVVRRPVVENGEAKLGTPPKELVKFYRKDYDLLKDCSLVFAIPLQRDPGALVEIGIAIELGIPVVTYDPRSEANNTMVVCGSYCYSSSLDSCINATFECLSKKLMRSL
ncbi:MAG: nucleoside 2-deoxyribosyltransferase [Cyanobacteria bacterium HKST-UBA02]|nr:nucleoside 2-deoxyribosyltransferase [Cyanobacteria bacterium HKST-UBA02]